MRQTNGRRLAGRLLINSPNIVPRDAARRISAQSSTLKHPRSRRVEPSSARVRVTLRFVHRQMDYLDFIDLRVEEEVGLREDRRFRNALKLSGLSHHKALDQFDFIWVRPHVSVGLG